MITLKNNKLPIIYLKLHKYKVERENEYVKTYTKTIVSKNEYNSPLYYFINIFYHKQDNLTEICVSMKSYNPYLKDYEYDFYSGEYENKSIDIIKKFDRKLLKYLELRGDE